jgi:uncharacterized protein (DUF2267 family)
MMRDRRWLIEDVMWRSGLHDSATASTVLSMVLEELPALLRPDEARFVASSLPEGVAAPLTRPGHRAPRAPRALYERLSAAGRCSRGVAMEHAQAACGALADALGDEPRDLLARRLPPEWAVLFESPPREAGEEARGTVPGHGHTLATGRPGSEHPLAEGASPSAQTESVVRADNPHGDTKLSSAREAGPTPLATAHPGTDEPIAEARDERQRR